MDINFGFLVLIFFLGFMSGCYFLTYKQNVSFLKYQQEVEKIFNSIISKFNDIVFTKRINKYAYFQCGEYDILYQLDNNSIHILSKDTCIATSNQIKNSVIPKNLIKKIKDKWEDDINDVTIIGENIFSNNFLKQSIINETKKWTDPILNKIEEEKDVQYFSVDKILDKINEVGYANLTNEEKEFLNNSSK
jgi:hypothetical protein